MKTIGLTKVTRRSQIIKNLQTFSSYAQSSNPNERSYYAKRLKAGSQYVVALANNGGYIFCPSRVVGYANITMRRHLNAGNNRDGRITTPAITTALGEKPAQSAKLKKELAAACAAAGVRLDSKKHSFWMISEGVELPQAKLENEIIYFESEIRRSCNSSRSARKARLVKARKKPVRKIITVTVFVRNPDVVAEVLYRSAGKCEVCQKAAPFKRSSDESPYLEVHHIRRLADGGDDVIENALACCPNCHRREHYG